MNGVEPLMEEKKRFLRSLAITFLSAYRKSFSRERPPAGNGDHVSNEPRTSPNIVSFAQSDSSVIPITMHAGWPLTKLEIADGFYAPWCATLRYMIDHLSIGVFVSFASVSIAHLVFWGDFISGDRGLEWIFPSGG